MSSTIGTSILEEDPLAVPDDLALALGHRSEPPVGPHVTLPDHVVAGLGSPQLESVLAQRQPGQHRS